MQNIPSARDPWVMLERTPGIIMDRANVGGNQSGQQSGYISRGAVDRQQQVVDRRRRHHRHGRDRRVADLLRLRHARRNAGHHGRRGRHAADRRRRHQPRDQERHRSVQGQRPRYSSPTRSSRPTTSPPELQGAGRRLRRADPEHQGLRLRRRRPDQEGQGCGSGAATARRTSRSASSASTRTPRSAVPAARRSTRARPTRTLLRSCLDDRPHARSTTTT